MSGEGERTLGERVTELRTQRGLSQKELAGEVGRSESWVSQVERDVLKVERVPVLRALADALGVSVRELRPEAVASGVDGEQAGRVGDMDALRMALTGHPTPDLLLSPQPEQTADVEALAGRVAQAWSLTHAGDRARPRRPPSLRRPPRPRPPLCRHALTPDEPRTGVHVPGWSSATSRSPGTCPALWIDRGRGQADT